MNNNINNVSTQDLLGNVLVKVKKGKTVLKSVSVHNTATLYLLYNMLLSLSGEFDTDYLPQYIGAGVGVTSSDDNIPQLKSLKSETTLVRAPLIANYKGAPTIDTTTNSVSVIYQGIIPDRNLAVSNNIKEIGLFGTAQGNTLLARIQLEEPLSLSTGESLVVEWTFNLKNAQ